MKGSVTIYLTLILTIVFSLLCTTIEGARLKAVHAKTKSMTVLAADSAMAQYCRELFEDYGLMFCLEETIDQNLLDGSINETGLYKTTLESMSMAEKVYAVDKDGQVFADEVLDNMKYTVTKQTVEEILNRFNIFKKHETQEEGIDTEKGESAVDNLTEEAEAINKEFKKIIKVKGDAKEYIENLYDVTLRAKNLMNGNKKITSEIKRSYKKENKQLKKHLDKIIPLLEAALDKIVEFDEKKDHVTEFYEKIDEQSNTSEIDIFSKNKTIIETSLLKLRNIKAIVELLEPDLTASNINETYTNIEKARIAISGYPLSNLVVREKQEKQDSVVDYIKSLVKNGKLALVVDDINKVSAGSVMLEDLPSKTVDYKNKKSDSDDLFNKALYSQYLVTYFGSYTNNLKETSLKYELEYLLIGNKEDRENLSKTVDKLVLTREGFNLLYIAGNSQKRQETKIMATGLVGWTGIPILIYITQALIMAAWTLGESIIDVKTLLKGNKIEILKTNKNWKLSLQNLGKLGSSLDTKGDKKGLTYTQYLQCLLLLEKNNELWFRTMDLIQMNMQKRYAPSFQMTKCIHSIEVRAIYKTKPVFLNIPLTDTIQQNYKITY